MRLNIFLLFKYKQREYLEYAIKHGRVFGQEYVTVLMRESLGGVLQISLSQPTFLPPPGLRRSFIFMCVLSKPLKINSFIWVLMGIFTENNE